jgi:hypothetical protein
MYGQCGQGQANWEGGGGAGSTLKAAEGNQLLIALSTTGSVLLNSDVQKHLVGWGQRRYIRYEYARE